MRRGLTKFGGNYRKREERNEEYSVGNLDLVSLRLNLPEREGIPGSRRFEKGSGDTYTTESRIHHPLQGKDIHYLSPNTQRNPQGYESRSKYKNFTDSEDVVLLYSKDGNRRVIRTEPLKQTDFLYPTKKKLRPKTADFGAQNLPGVNSNDNFPFKITSSGKLKVESSQVVFSSRKLSVLVADPANTRVNINSEPIEIPPLQMTHHESPDYAKTPHSPMETLMSQAGGFSSLGSLIGNSPIRSPTKEASEYESKQTSEILDPELNLGRLGYNGSESVNWDKKC